MGAVLTNDGGDGPDKNEQIENRRPTVEVLVVQSHPFLKRDAASSIDLPKTCDARHNGEPTHLVRPVVLDLARQWRPRADKRHFTTQNVEKIRQLVDTRAPKKRSQRMQARIVLDLEDRTVYFV